jgi:hypothetical protein
MESPLSAAACHRRRFGLRDRVRLPSLCLLRSCERDLLRRRDLAGLRRPLLRDLRPGDMVTTMCRHRQSGHTAPGEWAGLHPAEPRASLLEGACSCGRMTECTLLAPAPVACGPATVPVPGPVPVAAAPVALAGPLPRRVAAAAAARRALPLSAAAPPAARCVAACHSMGT